MLIICCVPKPQNKSFATSYNSFVSIYNKNVEASVFSKSRCLLQQIRFSQFQFQKMKIKPGRKILFESFIGTLIAGAAHRRLCNQFSEMFVWVEGWEPCFPIFHFPMMIWRQSKYLGKIAKSSNFSIWIPSGGQSGKSWG